MPEEIFQHLKKVRVRQRPLNISRLGSAEPEPARKRPVSGKTATEEKKPGTRTPRRTDREGRPARPSRPAPHSES
jgi:ATP-dependent RNA helicase DeaD